MDHFYVFYVSVHGNMYERTCGCERAAKERVVKLKKLYMDAFYTVNALPKKSFY